MEQLLRKQRVVQRQVSQSRFSEGHRNIETGLWGCSLLIIGGPRLSTDGFGRKSTAKNISDAEQMKNAPIRACAKTAFVG
jgi:hypothetical protein